MPRLVNLPERDLPEGPRARPVLFPRHFLPEEVHEGFVRREVAGVLLLGPDPEVDFHGALFGLSLYDRMTP